MFLSVFSPFFIGEAVAYFFPSCDGEMVCVHFYACLQDDIRVLRQANMLCCYCHAQEGNWQVDQRHSLAGLACEVYSYDIALFSVGGMFLCFTVNLMKR